MSGDGHLPLNPRPCPTPEKLKFARNSRAHRLANKLEERHGVRLRIYLCNCGYWHLSSTNKAVRDVT